MSWGSSGWVGGSAAVVAALLLAAAAPAAPPANDNFANEQVISGETGSTSGNNAEATAEPGEPSHTGWDAAYSVWYRWTAPYTGKVAFEAGVNYVSSPVWP